MIRPVVDADVVEEAGLAGAFGGGRPVQPPGRGAADRSVGEGDVVAGEDLVELHAQIGQALPDLADRFLGFLPAAESVGEPDAVLAVPGAVHKPRRLLEVLPVHRVNEPGRCRRR